jgi:dTDP-4-dehydrorhamnose reductase
MKVLIVGSRGLLGTELMAAFCSSHQVLGIDLSEIDITDLRQCYDKVEETRPDVIINSAGLTRVDYCETHEEEAFLVNGHGAGNLSKAAAAAGSLLVYYSTDYIFDGLKREAYLEDDIPNPQSIYGKSKLFGEDLVRRHCPKHLILRTSWLFGRNGNNFILTIVEAAKKGERLRVVNDQRGSPTYAKDLASHTLRMVEAGCRATYHVTNSDACTWYELAVKALEWAEVEGVSIVPISTQECARPAPRPANSVLANARLEREAFPLMRSWQVAALDYINFHVKPEFIGAGPVE